MSTLEADLTWTGSSFESGIRIGIDAEGRIAAVGPLDRSPDVRLEGQALIPGFVNAHSHAFQRGLRGRGEVFPDGSGSFWTWRHAMYELVASLGPKEFLDLTRRAFAEMRHAGITCVGEFHYFHHADEELGFELDRLVAEAAAQAGIRLVLLTAAYRTGGIGQPLEATQRRFDTRSSETFWERLDATAAALAPGHSMGVAAHSTRAVPIDEIAALHEQARDRGLIFHMHVEEQRAEIDACKRAYGVPPLELLLREVDVGPEFTAVHCTHSSLADLERFVDTGATVCLCPLTEANLGDGIPELGAGLGVDANFALGTDSNARIAPIEEMRWLEYTQRLRTESRGVVGNTAGRVAERLLDIATLGGARSLGVPTGAIEAGRYADFAAVDLEHETLAGATADTLLEHVVFGAGNGVVAATCVGGEWRQAARPAETGFFEGS